MRKIRKIVIHCTDSEDSLDIGFREINDWHKQRGWLSPSGISCGYHYIVRKSGKVERGRPESELGAHVQGHNKDSIGVVWVGRKGAEMGYKQSNGLYSVVRLLLEKYGLKTTDVYGHYELDDHKTCPNLDMNFFRGSLLFHTPDIIGEYYFDVVHDES